MCASLLLLFLVVLHEQFTSSLGQAHRAFGAPIELHGAEMAKLLLFGSLL